MTEVTKNPYNKTTWIDEIYDPVTQETLSEGTLFTAKRANNIEDGIYNAHNLIILQQREIQRLRLSMELDGRVPNHNGSFTDNNDEQTQRITRLLAKTDVTADVTAGTITLPVADTTGFAPMTYATIYDADSYEHTLVTSVDESAKTISVQALAYDYSKGAKVARSTANIDANNQTLEVGPFVTYDVQLVEVV